MAVLLIIIIVVQQFPGLQIVLVLRTLVSAEGNLHVHLT